MGLDSVELLMEIERAFGIDVPDPVAARLFSARHVVEYVTELRALSTETDELERSTLEALLERFRDMLPPGTPVAPDTQLSALIDGQPAAVRDAIITVVGDYLPGSRVPHPRRQPTWLGAVVSGLFGHARADEPLSLRQLNDAINARNMVIVRGMPGLRTAYEAQLVVMHLLEDKIGVDMLAIRPEKSFTNDYGID